MWSRALQLGRDPSRDAGVKPPPSTGTQGTGPTVSRRRTRGEIKGEKQWIFEAQSPIPAWREEPAVLCCESPFQMLRGAVLPSRDYRGECGLGQAPGSRARSSPDRLSPQVECYPVGFEHEYLSVLSAASPGLTGKFCFMCFNEPSLIIS